MTCSLFVVESAPGTLTVTGAPISGAVEYVPRQRWIPVGERLPEIPAERAGDGVWVLVFDPNLDEYDSSGALRRFVGEGNWDGSEWHATDWFTTLHPTHWMPLPEGPEE